MPTKLVLQQRGASGLNTVAEIPALENGKIDMSWLPVVGESGAAIIARGSNANGEWVRWEDGTQVCWHGSNVSPLWNNSLCFISIVYPVAFIALPVVISIAIDAYASSRGVYIGGYNNRSATGCVMYARTPSTTTSALNEAFEYYLIAIGRWK